MTNVLLRGLFLISLVLFFHCSPLRAQPSLKTVAECTITYSVTFQENKNGHTTKKLFIKGRKTRSEVSNSSFYQATIFDAKTGEAVVLKEIGGDKYLSSFTKEQWKDKNSQWDSSVVKLTNETKKILNYNCRKALIQTKDGESYDIYFTENLAASANENPYQFKSIPGLILEYESENKEGKNIEFTATEIDFNPVPAAKFIIPTVGYRVIR